MLNFLQDDAGHIQRGVERVIKDHEQDFALLRYLRFLYTYKMGDPQYDKDDQPIEGFVRKLPNRERDIYERDAEICVHFDSWRDKTKRQRYQLLYRQLLSIRIELDGGDPLQVVQDDDGRVIFRIDPPDLVVRLYTKELEKFGLPTKYKRVVKRLSGEEASHAPKE